MPKKYVVRLSKDERSQLRTVISKLSGSSQKVRRAQILLKADTGGLNWTDEHIAEAFFWSGYGSWFDVFSSVTPRNMVVGLMLPVFRIQAEDGGAHIVPLNLTEPAGIIRLPLPTEVPDLSAGKQYLWSVTFLCQEFAGPDSPMLSGWLETQATFGESMSAVTPSLAQAAQYRNNALWYDMISMLANLKHRNPNNALIDQAWHIVLERHHLGEVSDKLISR